MVVQVNDVGMELRAEELRIGNWVNCPREDQNPFRIDLMEYVCDGHAKVGMNVHKYDTPFGLIDGHPLTWELKDLKPIPLTEKILFKIKGVEILDKSEWEYVLKISAAKLYFRFNNGHCYTQFNDTYLGDIISALHELQNFCHVFKKELNVKL